MSEHMFFPRNLNLSLVSRKYLYQKLAGNHLKELAWVVFGKHSAALFYR